MKKNLIYKIIAIVLIIILVFFVLKKININDDKPQGNIELDKESFKKELEQVINIVDENKIVDLNNVFYMYGSDYFYGLKMNEYNNYDKFFNKNDIKFEYITEGQVILKNDGSLYLTASSDKYCALKDFYSENFEIYNISEQEKCHKIYVDGEKLTLKIISFNLENAIQYNSGDISNKSIGLSAICNVLDSNALSYKWYRDGVLTDNNTGAYYILNNEDAEYVVEITTIDGQSIKSEPFHVIINK